ncbi:hypothetical protein LY78DRAFT_542274, partial [Colletotrichum sublineola]
AMRLNFSSPSPHLFASVCALLQQWGNTLFPNGHTIATVELPAFTLLYHGRLDEANGPPSPDWLSFDIEMAYGLMGGTRRSFILTYQATRPIKALYFDGQSAALFGFGQLDTQMLHLYANVSGPDLDGSDGGGNHSYELKAEYDRATGLCDWLQHAGLRGKGWGIEGIVRMNAGFEMIWCDFTAASLQLVSRMNVTAPQMKHGRNRREADNDAGRTKEAEKQGHARKKEAQTSPQTTVLEQPTSTPWSPIPPDWSDIVGPPDREPFLLNQGSAWFESATWHYGFTGAGRGAGETRARVLGCGIVSWYGHRYWGSVVEEERERLNLSSEGYWGGHKDSSEEVCGSQGVALSSLRRRRRMHHLEGVTVSLAEEMRQETKEMLRDAVNGQGCSGMDWVSIMGDIAQRISRHLASLELYTRVDVRNEKVKRVSGRKWLSQLRGQSHMFFVSSLEYPSVINAETWQLKGRLFTEVCWRCQY